MLRVAEDLDADYVIYGKYAAKGSTLTVEMRVLRMDPLALRAPIQESGPLESLMELHTRVLWRTLSSGTGHYALSLADFTDRKSTRLNSSHSQISYAVFCLKKK